jgi:hypothetical protein
MSVLHASFTEDFSGLSAPPTSFPNEMSLNVFYPCSNSRYYLQNPKESLLKVRHCPHAGNDQSTKVLEMEILEDKSMDTRSQKK